MPNHALGANSGIRARPAAATRRAGRKDIEDKVPADDPGQERPIVA